MSSWLWEDVSHLEGAEKAARGGMWAAVFVAGVTAAIALLSLAGVRILGIDAWALVDAVIFAAIAFGIHRKSRVAAVAGLCLYILERIIMFRQGGGAGLAMGVVITLFFVNSVRGTFAYRHLVPKPPVSEAPLP